MPFTSATGLHLGNARAPRETPAHLLCAPPWARRCPDTPPAGHSLPAVPQRWGQRGQRVLRGGRQGPPRGQWSPAACSTLDEPRRLAVFHQYKSLATCTCVRAHYIARKQSVKNSLSVEVPAGWNDPPREPGLLQAVLPPRSARGRASGHPQGRAHLACAERPPRLCRLEKAPHVAAARRPPACFTWSPRTGTAWLVHLFIVRHAPRQCVRLLWSPRGQRRAWHSAFHKRRLNEWTLCNCQ